jgi:stage IV sporulation protein B
VDEVKNEIKKCDGKISLQVDRGGKRVKINLEATKVGEEYRLGVILSDITAGIGTVTYINPTTGEFGGLGHGICNPDTGAVLPMESGDATGVVLSGARQGEDGKPGELRGVLTDKIIGGIYSNTDRGVFGELNDKYLSLYGKRTALPIGHKNEVHEGEATIISTIKSGKTDYYTITIKDIDRGSDGSKSFKITVTDPALLALSGGIVRGMSGSPIIQDGKLVGAVTHVMVADPTEGYGIFIENMLDAAQNQVIPKAA